MKRIFLAVFLTLAACETTPVASFRDQNVPISSTTRATAHDMAGTWYVRATFGGAMAQKVEFHAGPSGQIAMLVTDGVSSGLTETIPGRYRATSGAAEYWVLWVDADFRTAAIGTPSGEFGWIIDRSQSGGADRMIAAREILDWVGYDMMQLVNTN